MDDTEQLMGEGRELVEAVRARCLWFLRPDYLPSDAEAMSRVLRQIEERGTREEYLRARKIRECLSRLSNRPSAE
jgi:hypothetical protein